MPYKNVQFYLLVLTICILFCNCNKNQKEFGTGIINKDKEFAVIRIRKEKAQVKKVSELFGKIEYVRLQTTDDCLIGNIDKLYITKDNILVSDYTVAKSVFVFDAAGKFKYKIETGVKTKGTLNSITDVAVWEPKKQFFVFSSAQKKIFVYNFNGRALGTIKLPAYFDHLETVKDGFLLSRERSKSRSDSLNNLKLCLFDWQGKPKKGWFTGRINKSLTFDITINPIVSLANGASFIRSYYNSIYFFNSVDSELTKKYLVDFGANNIESAASTSNDYEEFNRITKQFNYQYILGNVADTPNYLYFMYTDNATVGQFFRDKRAHKDYLLSGFDNDIEPIPVFPFTCGNESFFSTVVPSAFIKSGCDWVKKNDPNNKKPGSKQLLDAWSDISETDNPIIAKYYLK